MSKTDVQRIPDYLGHILEAIERIDRYLADTDEVTFLNDQKTQDAVVRNFEIIGEAAHNIESYHAAFAAAHPDIPWSVIYAMRNRVAHGYFKVDLENHPHRPAAAAHPNPANNRSNQIARSNRSLKSKESDHRLRMWASFIFPRGLVGTA